MRWQSKPWVCCVCALAACKMNLWCFRENWCIRRGGVVAAVNLLLVIFILPCLSIGYGDSVLFSVAFVVGKIQRILKILHFYPGLCGFASLLVLVAVGAVHIYKLIPCPQVLSEWGCHRLMVQGAKVSAFTSPQHTTLRFPCVSPMEWESARHLLTPVIYFANLSQIPDSRDWYGGWGSKEPHSGGCRRQDVDRWSLQEIWE